MKSHSGQKAGIAGKERAKSGQTKATL